MYKTYARAMYARAYLLNVCKQMLFIYIHECMFMLIKYECISMSEINDPKNIIDAKFKNIYIHNN